MSSNPPPNTEELKIGRVMQFKVDSIDADMRLDLYVVQKLARPSRNQVQILIDDQKVKIDGVVRRANAKVRLGQVVEVEIPIPKKLEILPEDIPLEILYEDEHILVINKEPGLVVHPAPGHAQHTMVNAILNHCISLAKTDNPLRPGIVHRLDKDTSGCLLVAKNEEALGALGTQFEKRRVEKQYLALLHGKMTAYKGEIQLGIGRHPVDRKKMAVTLKGKSAHTLYEVVEKFESATLVRVQLRTGRTHQIRVHMAHLGHPVLGDSDYGKRGADVAKELGISRQLLHAEILGITHPVTKEKMTFQAPMPQDLAAVLTKLRDRART